MSLYVDIKFVSLVSTKLDRFARKSEYLWNFRCPVCGDSSKNKFKARGYIYRQKSNLFFSCHNCSASLSFGNFLKTMDGSLYKEYQLERFKNESSSNVAKPDFSLVMKKPVFDKSPKIRLPTIECLADDHSAKVFLTKRKVPKGRFADIFYANDFMAFVKEILPNYEKTLKAEDPRIIIPFYDENKKLLGFQGRTLGSSKIKYITIKVSDDSTKVFGLDKIDKAKKVLVVEGPIDSMFLDNSLATMDASLYNIGLSAGHLDYTFVYDNEPRNSDVCRHMLRTIELGKDIVIWPSQIKEKDINEMILSGKSISEIHSIIHNNTFSKHLAMLEYNLWKRV